MRKEVKKCPLSLVDWVNYLTFEQNRERYDYYNEEVSFLSNMIVSLTIILGAFGFLSVINVFDFISDDIKLACAIVSSVIFVTVLLLSSSKWKYYKKQKQIMVNRIIREGDIIEDILRGNETDVQCISKRYFDIWKKQRDNL
jgi:hypothetical protein